MFLRSHNRVSFFAHLCMFSRFFLSLFHWKGSRSISYARRVRSKIICKLIYLFEILLNVNNDTRYEDRLNIVQDKEDIQIFVVGSTLILN